MIAGFLSGMRSGRALEFSAPVNPVKPILPESFGDLHSKKLW
jgi:hypothetical protein